MKRVHVRVPATVANLGPGFDSLALAVRLYNELEVAPLDSGLQLRIEGQGQDTLPTDERNLIVQAAQLLAESRRRRLPGLRLTCRNRIPLGTGLGSSAAAIVAGLLAADALLAPDGRGAAEAPLTAPRSVADAPAELPYAELLALANRMEGHADNAAAALLGGLVIVGSDQRRPIYRRVEPALRELVVVLPQLDLPTHQMRQALPEQVPLIDAAFNLGRTALVVEALRAGDFSLMSQAMADRLHQPHRRQHIPAYTEVVAAARQAGAAAVVLSGAGPGLAAFAESELQSVALAMVDAFRRHGVPARQLILAVERDGAQVSSQ